MQEKERAASMSRNFGFCSGSYLFGPQTSLAEDDTFGLEHGRHAAGLQNDRNLSLFRGEGRKFKTIRAVIHAPHAANTRPAGKSENHVSTTLLIPGSSEAVCGNVRTFCPSTKGVLRWPRYQHDLRDRRMLMSVFNSSAASGSGISTEESEKNRR